MSIDMALPPEVCVQRGPSGLDPSGGFRLPDVDSLDAAAQALQRNADDFLSGVSAVAGRWQGLSGSYSSDESAVVLAAFGKVTPAAERVQRDGASTALGLTNFSSTCRELKQRLEAYGHQVRSLDADIGAFPTSVEKTTMVKGEQITTQVQQHWSGDADLTARHDVLAGEVKDIRNDYLAAQNTCAAALAAVSGGEVHTVSQPARTDLRSGNWVDDWLWDAGTSLGIDHNAEEQPWGKETVPYRPNGVLGFLQGVGAGAVELVDGVWSMTFTGNQAKRDQAWGGVNALIGAAGTLAATPLSMFDQSKREREAPEVQKALDLFGSMAPAFLYADEADTNPNWAAGGATFNIGTLLLSRGGSAPLKVGSLASKASTLTEGTMGLSKAAGAIAGKLSQARVAVWDHGVGGALQRLDNGLARLGQSIDGLAPQPAFAGIATRIPDTAGSGTWLTHVDSTALDNPKIGPVSPPPANGSRLLDHTRVDPSLPGRRSDLQPAIRDTELGRSTSRHPGDGREVPPAPREYPRPVVEHTVDVASRDGSGSRTAFAARTDLEADTIYSVENRGDFYTDNGGKVTYVETSYGGRGNLNPDLMQPQPNTTYVVHPDVHNPVDGASHAHVFQTDAQGRTVLAHTDQLALGQADRSESVQSRVGDEGGDGYDGGHLFGKGFGGGGEYSNLVAMLRNLNRGAGDSFYNLENQWRSILKADPSAKIEIDIRSRFLGDSKVPERFEVLYRVNDGPLIRKGFKNE